MNERIPRKEEGNPSVGVVLAGGGIRPMGASYIFDLLEELEIPVHILAATSGGVPVTAARAIGYTGEEMRSYFLKFIANEKLLQIDYLFLLNLLGSVCGIENFDSKRGLTKQNAIQQVYEKIFGDMRLEELDIPLLIQATDLYTGEPVILEKGPLALSICASGALVPVLPARMVEGQWLIEGSYSRETPFTELVKKDIDFIINVSIVDPPSVEFDNVGEQWLDFINKCFFRLSQTQRMVGVSVHHNETVMIPIQYNADLKFWEAGKTQESFELCKSEIYKYRDEIFNSYRRAVEKSYK